MGISPEAPASLDLPAPALPTFFDALSLADILEDALLIFRPPSTLLYANPAAMAFAGRLAFNPATSRGDFIGAGRLLGLLPPGATELALDGGYWNSQLQASCVDGNKIQMRASVRNLKRPVQGEDVLVALFGCISGSAEAVTDSAEAFERQSASIERTIQSEKMASIGQLAAGVAHEINNPIGYVLSNFGTLQEYQRSLFALIELQDRELQAAGDAAALARVAEIRRRLDVDFTLRDLPHLLSESKEGIRRVQKIVGDLKELARPSRQERWIECDLHKGLDTAINILWSDLKYKVKLQLDYGDIPPVQCQPTELNQAFLNILLNAGQAIRDRGEIGIRTTLHEDEVWVDIADTGEGITDSNRARIFEPFFGTKADQGCTGLGLSIAYSIVRKHQGRIEVDSRPGGGSRFRVVLPVSQSGAGQVAADIEPDSP